MTQHAKKTIILWLTAVGMFGLCAISLVSRGASEARSAELHARILSDSTARLNSLVNEAQLLSESYRLSNLNILKEGCKKTGQRIKLEVSCPWWHAMPDMWPDENPAQWGRITQLGQAVAATLIDPDKLKQLTPEQTAALKGQCDALKTELDNVQSKQSGVWRSNNSKDIHLELADTILQLVVTLLYTAALVVLAVRDDSMKRPKTGELPQPSVR